MAAPTCRTTSRLAAQCRAASRFRPAPPTIFQAQPYHTTSIHRANQTTQSSPFNGPDPDLTLPQPADLSSLAHTELEQHREIRELTRIAAWEMPHLSTLSVPFVPPTSKSSTRTWPRTFNKGSPSAPLRWRYTTHFSDPHPASSKVTVEFAISNLGLTLPQASKLAKLAGTRYDPERGTVRIASQSFDTAAQNKRYLADIVQKLIAEAKNGEDGLKDVPLDTRHHRFEKRLRFPEAWKMTGKRRGELEEGRRIALLEAGFRVGREEVVDGRVVMEVARVEKAREMEEARLLRGKETVKVKVVARKGR